MVDKKKGKVKKQKEKSPKSKKEEKPVESNKTDTAKESDTAEKHSPKKNNQNRILATIALIAIIVVIGVVLYGNNASKNFESTLQGSDQVIATINGEEITESQLDKDYRFFFFVTGYPPQYQGLISKKDFLNQTIAQTLLLQEAKNLGYVVKKEEAEKELGLSISENALTIEEFEQRVKEANFTMEDVIEYSAAQLTLSKFIEETIFSSIEVSEKEINDFYEENKELLKGSTNPTELNNLIQQELMVKKQREVLEIAIEMLMEDADIEIIQELEDSLIESQLEN